MQENIINLIDENGVESIVYGTTVNANVFNVMLAIFSENKSESDIEIAKGLLAKEEISKEYQVVYFTCHKSRTM